MNAITLNHNLTEDSDILCALEKLLDAMIKVQSEIKSDVKSCVKVRNIRKELQTLIPQAISHFPHIDDERKQDFEDNIIKIKNRIKFINHKLKNGEIQFKYSLTKRFMVREFKILAKIFTNLHDTITKNLYSQNTYEVSADKKLQKRIVEAWGEHAFQEF